MSRDLAISVADVRMSYLGAEVLHGVTAQARAGALTLLSGPSGSGKTTLLNLVGALDVADAGSIVVGDVDVVALPTRQRAAFRAGLGLVFQRSGLIRGLTARENIEVPHVLAGHGVDRNWVNKLAADLGIADVIEQSSQTLSGGQAQRVAVIRALAHRPSVVLADEPTASVDSDAKTAIHEVLRATCRSEGTAVLLVSHEAMSVDYADRTLTMTGGRLSMTARPEQSESSSVAPSERLARRRRGRRR